jgi:putative transposase
MTGLKKSWASQTTNLSAHQIVLSHINRQAPLSIVEQTTLLGIARSSVYYVPVAPNPEDFIIMNQIDEIYTEQPYYGYRPMTKQLQRDGFMINHKRTARLMRDMGLEAIYPKPNLSKNNIPHTVYPYLLKHLNIVRPNQVWGTDITYIKMEQGFVYLVAFLDWFSRYVVSWQLSTTLTTDFVVEAATRALKTANPEIINSDQGVQFTSQDYLTIWNPDKTRISMDHRGRCFDNIFTERLWRSVKYNDIYPNDYDTVLAVKDGLTKYFDIYNNRRLHQSNDYRPPAEIYFN